MYSWFPGAGRVMLRNRPHDWWYAAWKLASSPHWYWLSPRGSTSPMLLPLSGASSAAVATSPRKPPGGLLMSPAAAMLSACAAGVIARINAAAIPATRIRRFISPLPLRPRIRE
jgi:hypothetical protein